MGNEKDLNVNQKLRNAGRIYGFSNIIRILQ